MQVKLLDSKYAARLEQEVNDFLTTVNAANVVSIAYQAVYANGGTNYSVLIVYQPKI